MKPIWISLCLALAGLAIAGLMVFFDSRAVTIDTPPPAMPRVPFAAWVAGTGTIEASSGNISIGTPVSGIVTQIFVKVGDHVVAGQPLFKIDDRDLQAEVLTADAQVAEAAAALQQPSHQLETKQRLRRHDRNAVSAQDLRDLEDAAGLARAKLQLARARAEELRKEIDYHTVSAPVSGAILQLKMRVGEYVEASAAVTPLLILGNDTRMNVRVSVDEFDAWRVHKDASAIAYVRGRPSLKIPLKFEYTEPFVVPKTALLGYSTERTDTRVLQVIYSFEHGALPVYVGERLDVYIAAPKDQEAGSKAG